MAISVDSGSSVLLADRVLGADLHDRVIGSMSALILEMERFKRDQYNRASVQASVSTFQESMRAALAELRALVGQLQGGLGHGLEKGLLEAIRIGPLADLHRRTWATTKIVASPRFPRRLDAFTETQLFRIAEQALNNAAVHSGACNVVVSLRVVGDWLDIQIADDGRGYNWTTRFDGQGITGMEQRANLIGGRLDIDNRAGGGTVVRVRVPRKALS